jgi:WD40 repeat protein
VLVAFSPDGQTVASASLDEPLKLWDRATGGPLRNLLKPPGPVISLAFAADGKSLEVVTVKRKVFDGKSRPSLESLAETLRWQEIPLDGSPSLAKPLSLNRLPAPASAMVGMPGATELIRAGQIVVKGGVLAPLCLARSADRKRLAIGGLFRDGKAPMREGAVLLWDLAANEEKGLARKLAPVSALAFSPDGGTLVSGDFDGAVKLWDVNNWPAPPRASLKDHSALVLSLAFSADGGSLASGGGDALVMIREAKTGQVQTVCRGHRESVSSVAFSSRERLLASAGQDGTIKLWDPATASGPGAVGGFRGKLLTAAFSQDGKTLTAVDQGGLLRVVDAGTGRERARLDLQKALRFNAALPRFAICAALSPDGRTVALGTALHGLILYDTATGKERKRVKIPLAAALAFSPDGTTVAVGTVGPEAGQIMLFPLEGDAEPRILPGHSRGVLDLAFSPDGARLASAGRDGKVRLWDAVTLKEQQVFVEPGGALSCLAFSTVGKGQLLASAAGDRVTIYETESGRTVRTLRGHHHQIAALAFCPGDRRLVTAGGGGDARHGILFDLLGRGGGVKLWDLATGQEVLTLGGATDIVSCVAFDRNGLRLASGRAFASPFAGINEGGEVRIWDATPTVDDKIKR